MITSRPRVGVLIAAIVIVLTGPFQGRASASVRTIDFSSAPAGSSISSEYFLSEGLLLTGPSDPMQTHVGFVQGDNALIGSTNAPAGDVTGTFTSPVSSVAVAFAPGAQGTAEYTLTAYAQGTPLASSSVTVMQDERLQDPVPWGYSELSLIDLSKPAESFSLTARYIDGFFGRIEYGVSYITFATVDAPVTKRMCKDNGWRTLGYPSLGRCVSAIGA
jgi:hypothetical protein